MMAIAAGLGPGQEIYSIDESFIDMSTMRGDLVSRSHRVRERIVQWTGLATGIGIGATKTLANHVAERPQNLCLESRAVTPPRRLFEVFQGVHLTCLGGHQPCRDGGRIQDRFARRSQAFFAFFAIPSQVAVFMRTFMFR